MIKLDYKALYNLDYDMSEGIIGLTNGGRIDVRVYDYDPSQTNGKGVAIYGIYITENSPDSYSENHINAQVVLSGANIDQFNIEAAGNDIKKRAQDARVYSPGQCNLDSWTDTFLSIWFNDCVGNYAPPVQPVVVEVISSANAEFIKAKIPGIGIISIDDQNIVRRQAVASFYDYCEDHANTPLCQLFHKIMNPSDDIDEEDILIAAHRGWWGYNMGDGDPENTLASLIAAQEQKGINIVEMDVTTSADHQLVLMHDYVMSRLTNYTGNEFSFQLPWLTMSQYKVRKRNESVSDLPLTQFSEVLSEVHHRSMILMLDIKELISKKTGNQCTANCDFQTKEQKNRSWVQILRQSIRQAESLNAKKNLIIKTYFHYDDLYGLIGNQVGNLLWTPMIVPNNFKNEHKQPDIQLMADFIDSWNTPENQHIVACFETNFFREDDVMLQPFTRNGHHYDNLLHYIYATTGKRSGIFSEEPVGPKGTVNRWGDWKVKDGTNDIRGDHFKLMSVPYANKMLITSDRLDVWQEIQNIF
ncbi:glycerophosphodiester phosphodiesterase family protein [Marinifilum caeruleilacunae]|nr:glycerophosphodiester phosphodiesterase family protein [Marinifilum caeruleilacunae]